MITAVAMFTIVPSKHSLKASQGCDTVYHIVEQLASLDIASISSLLLFISRWNLNLRVL